MNLSASVIVLLTTLTIILSSSRGAQSGNFRHDEVVEKRAPMRFGKRSIETDLEEFFSSLIKRAGRVPIRFGKKRAPMRFGKRSEIGTRGVYEDMNNMGDSEWTNYIQNFED